MALNNYSHFKKNKAIIKFFITSLLTSHPIMAQALDWQFKPSLSLQTVYSDNIGLLPKDLAEGAFVATISPGLSLVGKSARNRLNLNYQMQNIYNAGGNGDYSLFNQLQFTSKSEIKRKSLFFDARATMSQQNNLSSRNGGDNISGGQLRTNVTTFSVSPYWTPRFNGYFNGEVRFSYDKVMLENSLASNTDSFTGSINLVSGRKFSRFSWRLSYINREQKRKESDDIKNQNADGELRFHLGRKFNAFTQFGYSNNQFQSTTTNNQNGFFYTFGAQWIPSQRFNVELGYGNNSHISFRLLPTRHIRWNTTFNYRNIGTNTGFTWQTDFNWRTRKSVWTANYSEDTTTTQQVLLEQNIFALEDAFGNPLLDPVTNQPVQLAIDTPTLVDEVFIRRRLTVGASYKTGKSNFNAQIFAEQRSFQVNQNDNDVLGFSASWRWLFARRTSLLVSPRWERNQAAISNNERFNFSVDVTRSIPVRLGRGTQLNAKVGYRYTNQTADIAINEYKENRITANVVFTF